jgi:hydrogenase/urease accessory protein HupE
MATGLLHVAGIALGFFNRWRHGIMATRSVGGIIAASGAWFLYQALIT